MKSRNRKNEPMVAIDRVVEVTFFVAGFVEKQVYNLGNAQDMACWSMNERLTRCVQVAVKPVQTVTVLPSMFRQMQRSRKGMKAHIARCLHETRQRVARGAASGQ